MEFLREVLLLQLFSCRTFPCQLSILNLVSMKDRCCRRSCCSWTTLLWWPPPRPCTLPVLPKFCSQVCVSRWLWFSDWCAGWACDVLRNRWDIHASLTPGYVDRTHSHISRPSGSLNIHSCRTCFGFSGLDSSILLPRLLLWCPSVNLVNFVLCGQTGRAGLASSRMTNEVEGDRSRYVLAWQRPVRPVYAIQRHVTMILRVSTCTND